MPQQVTFLSGTETTRCQQQPRRPDPAHPAPSVCRQASITVMPLLITRTHHLHDMRSKRIPCIRCASSQLVPWVSTSQQCGSAGASQSNTAQPHCEHHSSSPWSPAHIGNIHASQPARAYNCQGTLVTNTAQLASFCKASDWPWRIHKQPPHALPCARHAIAQPVGSQHTAAALRHQCSTWPG